MDNREKYIEIFMSTFSLKREKLEGLEYSSVPEWDSVGHMNLISSLEDAFDIMMDTDDIIDLNSFEKGIEILQERYQIGMQ